MFLVFHTLEIVIPTDLYFSKGYQSIYVSYCFIMFSYFVLHNWYRYGIAINRVELYMGADAWNPNVHCNKDGA